jgi:hypothetical protein
MMAVLIGSAALVASLSSGFVPGIAVGVGLMGLGVVLALSDRTQS